MPENPYKPPTPITKKTNPTRSVEIPPTVKDTDIQTNNKPLRKNRADFDSEQFARVLKQKGYFLIWRKSLLCTCINPETEQVGMNCPACDGSGYVYIDPIPIQGLMTNFDRRDDIYRHPGHWLEGISSVTVEPQYRLGNRDSLEMRDSVMVFNEWIKKGNRDGIRQSLSDGLDSARYRITRINTLLAQIDGVPGKLTEGIHYKATETGLLEWTGKGEEVVEDGSYVSIHYEFHPVWIVASHPHTLRDTVSSKKKPEPTVEALPIQAVVKLDYLNTADSVNDNRFRPVTGSLAQEKI